MRGKLLCGIICIYVDSSANVRVKGGESEWFRINKGLGRFYGPGEGIW